MDEVLLGDMLRVSWDVRVAVGRQLSAYVMLQDLRADLGSGPPSRFLM